MPVVRFDRAPLKAVKNDEGFLTGEANLTRVGVFTYQNADGSLRRELRLPEEVFHAASLKSLAMRPMTLGHPVEAVTSKNVKSLTVGTVGSEVKHDGHFVRAPYAIHDDAAITAVETGKAAELSCGYNCDLEVKAGTYQGEHYDAIQRNIRYNHAALVSEGRAGPEVRIDAAVCIDSQQPKHTKRDTKMETVTIRIDGVDVQVSPQAAQMIKLREDRTAEAAKKAADELAASKAEADKQRGRADALDEKVKTLTADVSPEAINKRVADRVTLVTKASAVLSEKDATGKVTAFNADGKTDDEIKRLVILKVQPAADLKDKSADYVNARYDSAIEASKTTNDQQDAVTTANAHVQQVVNNADSAAGTNKAADAQKRMQDRARNAWKPQAATK